MDLKEEDILGDRIHDHWYYIAKGRAMVKFLEGLKTSEVLDVGAGSGIFSKQLLDQNICERAVCVDPGYETESTESYNGKTIQFTRSIDRTTQELLLMMDVLEHVPDDAGLISEYAETMSSGSHILITVPAFQFMWSGHDVFLEHYRRYTISMIEESVKKAGLTPVKSRYFFGSFFPLLASVRVAKNILFKRGSIQAKSEMNLYPAWINSSLKLVHDMERQSIFQFNRLMGLSVFCLCQKA